MSQQIPANWLQLLKGGQWLIYITLEILQERERERERIIFESTPKHAQ